MRVEEDWPEDQRAGSEKIISRLERFPEGFFVVIVDGEIVAVTTSTLVTYEPSDLSKYQTWEQCTNDGFLFPLADYGDYNANYIVSSGIMKAFRRAGIREAMIKTHLGLAKTLGMKYTLTGGMIPGYDAYCRENGDIPAEEYAFMQKDGKPIDPTLRKVGAVGLTLPDERHLIKDFYVSPESRNYGALLVHVHGT